MTLNPSRGKSYFKNLESIVFNSLNKATKGLYSLTKGGWDELINSLKFKGDTKKDLFECDLVIKEINNS